VGVSLIETPAKVHLALDDLGSTGVFARNISASASTAKVNVVAKVRNSTTTDGTYTVVASLVESDGKTVKKSVSTTAVVKAGTHVTRCAGPRRRKPAPLGRFERPLPVQPSRGGEGCQRQRGRQGGAALRRSRNEVRR
jgi:hypothetical protein